MLWKVWLCDVQREIEAAVAGDCHWVAVASITAPNVLTQTSCLGHGFSLWSDSLSLGTGETKMTAVSGAGRRHTEKLVKIKSERLLPYRMEDVPEDRERTSRFDSSAGQHGGASLNVPVPICFIVFTSAHTHAHTHTYTYARTASTSRACPPAVPGCSGPEVQVFYNRVKVCFLTCQPT